MPIPQQTHNVSEEALEEFRAIYRDAFKEEISDEEVLRMATNLLTLYERLSRPLLSEQKGMEDDLNG